MGRCRDCGEWCNDKYDYCWDCHKENIDDECPKCGKWKGNDYFLCYECNNEEIIHKCIICGESLYSERWKDTCHECYKKRIKKDEKFIILKKEEIIDRFWR